MKIGIDASRMISSIKKTGVEVVGGVIVSKLFTALNSEREVILYTPELLSDFPETNQRIIKAKRLWTVIRLSVEMLLHKPDAFFSPVHELPFFCPQKTYRIIHDVAFLKSFTSYSLFQRIYMLYGLQRSVQICEKIFVPTQGVKDDIAKHYPEAADKIEVIGFGFERKNPTNNIVAKQNYFVYIGRIETKKNIANLIKAFEIFSQKYSDYKLVLAGKPGFGFDILEKQIKSSSANIELKGYISDEEKFKLQFESKAVLLVSKEEGFGIPVLEAMDVGTRVVASDIPVLHEVGGDIPIFVDPESPESIADGLEQVVENDTLNVDEGFSYLEKFNWNDVIAKIKKSF